MDNYQLSIVHYYSPCVIPIISQVLLLITMVKVPPHCIATLWVPLLRRTGGGSAFMVPIITQ